MIYFYMLAIRCITMIVIGYRVLLVLIQFFWNLVSKYSKYTWFITRMGMVLEFLLKINALDFAFRYLFGYCTERFNRPGLIVLWQAYLQVWSLAGSLGLELLRVLIIPRTGKKDSVWLNCLYKHCGWYRTFAFLLGVWNVGTPTVPVVNPQWKPWVLSLSVPPWYTTFYTLLPLLPIAPCNWVN